MPQFRIDYGDAVIADGFFLPRQGQPKYVGGYADGEGTFFRHISTFPDKSTIKETVIDLLERAQRHVFFCNFLLQDEEVLQAILNASKRLRGHVYLLTTLKADDFQQTGSVYDKDEGDFDSHMHCIKQLSSQGVLIKARSDCHAKFMTIDDDQAIVTSANAVPTCYGNVAKADRRTREANPENGVYITLPIEVGRLANFFRAMWQHGCNYYVAPDVAVFEVQQHIAGTPLVKPVEPAHPCGEGEVIWTAPSDPRILRRFIDVIDRAQSRVRLSTWVIKGMDNHELGNTIRSAATRGVQFEILVRGMNWRDDHRRQCYLLARELGGQLTILGDYWNHSKAVHSDKDEAMVLTANMDAQHGLDNGVEVGFHSTHPDFVTAVSAFLDRLSAEAAFEFVADPTQAEMAERYGRQRGPRLEGNVHIQIKPKGKYIAKLARRWCDAANSELVRVKRPKGSDEVTLLTNTMSLTSRLTGKGTLVAHYINENPTRKETKSFDSYLGRCTLTCDVAAK